MLLLTLHAPRVRNIPAIYTLVHIYYIDIYTSVNVGELERTHHVLEINCNALFLLSLRIVATFLLFVYIDGKS